MPMAMYVPALLLLIASSPTMPGTTPVPAAPLCQETRRLPATERTRVTAHALGDEPNAALVATVLRSEDGCTRPVVIRDDIGGEPR